MKPENNGNPASPHQIKIAQPLFGHDVLDDIKTILESGYLRQGPRVKEFEESFREKTGAAYAYAVNNGTAALHAAYLSTVEPGDEVIVPSFTFLATASMVYHSGAKPVFADIDPDTYLIDPEDVKEKITPRTRAIAPVHLFGNAADIDGLRGPHAGGRVDGEKDTQPADASRPDRSGPREHSGWRREDCGSLQQELV